MVRVAVCDEILAHTDGILALLEDFKAEKAGFINMDFKVFKSGGQLIESIDSGERFDMFLLEIAIPDVDGIALAKHIRSTFDKNVPIIFLTKSKHYALDAFKVSAHQYMLKPILKRNLFPLLEKVIALYQLDSDTMFLVSAPGRKIVVNYSNVVVVEHSGRILRFHIHGGDILESKTIRTTFGNAVSDILDDRRFLRVHQSFVINMNYVLELRSKTFLMKNGMEVPIPRPKYASIKRIFLRYLADRK